MKLRELSSKPAGNGRSLNCQDDPPSFVLYSLAGPSPDDPLAIHPCWLEMKVTDPVAGFGTEDQVAPPSSVRKSEEYSDTP